MIRDSADLLVALQQLRRRRPSETDLANTIIDLLCEGEVALAVDSALVRLARRAA